MPDQVALIVVASDASGLSDTPCAADLRARASLAGASAHTWPVGLHPTVLSLSARLDADLDGHLDGEHDARQLNRQMAALPTPDESVAPTPDLLVSLLVECAALVRRESRGARFHPDSPELDPTRPGRRRAHAPAFQEVLP